MVRLSACASFLAVVSASSAPSDTKASAATTALFKSLDQISKSPAFIFGHHNTNYEGEHFTDPDCSQKRSDVKAAVGQFPGLFEYNFAWMAEGKHDLLPHVKHAVSVGAVVELHWEPSNPVTGGDVKDTSGDAVKQILPGGSAHGKWTSWLDSLSDFAKEVGHPMILRLFHENTGAWFWWGTASTQPEDFRAAFQFTINYLRDTKGVHNLLVAYSPAKPTDHPNAFSDTAQSLYPGDDVVDITCFDRYGKDDFHADLLSDCDQVVSFAEKHGKIPAICETGSSSGSQTLSAGAAKAWWTESLLNPIKNSGSCSKIAFALTWANRGSDSYWVPLPGQPSFNSFVSFHASPETLFAGDFSLALEDAMQV